MIDKKLSIPIFRQIQEEVMERIQSNTFKVGERIPSENKLAAKYQVTRLTVHKALEELVQKGILYRQYGKGTFVNENIWSYGLSTILSFSATLRKCGYQVDTKIIRIAVIPGTPDVLKKLDLPLESMVILIRRLRIVNEIPAAIHSSYLDHRVYSPILSVDLTKESLLESVERIGSVRIAYSYDSVHAGLVSTEDANRLDIPVGSPILNVEGIAFSETGNPIRLTRAVYRSDRFRLVMKNTGGLSTTLELS
ncbi:MAG: GntR family transcriptional regulator [Pelolinea sp.]|nr:GntR family transcriptional regulator [Pelolinea sp.]